MIGIEIAGRSLEVYIDSVRQATVAYNFQFAMMFVSYILNIIFIYII